MKSVPDPRSEAIVIGAGLGGLSAAMRLGAKGYRVTVLDRLDRAGGRGSSITEAGHRFDLGPTIVTVPEVFRKLWAACGRDFDADVELKPLDPVLRDPLAGRLALHRAQRHGRDGGRGAAALARRRAGLPAVPEGFQRRYVVGYEGMVAEPMHRLWDTIKVLPEFARLRADRSILGHAKARVRDERLRMALSFHPLFIGGDPMHVTSMYALVSHLEKEYGVHYAMGGVQAIADAMARVVEGQGGRLRLGVEADEILVRAARRRACGWFRARCCGRRCDLERGCGAHLHAAPAEPAPAAVVGREARPSEVEHGALRLVLRDEGHEGHVARRGHHTILSGPRYEGLLRDIFIKGRLADDMSLYVHRPSVTDPTVAPEGGDTFYALSPVPHLGHADPVDWAREEPRYREKVTRVLEGLIPGFERHLSASLVFTPETFRDRYLSPLRLRVLDRAAHPPVGLVPAAQRERGGAGAVPRGAGTHPGAGLPGVVSSAEVMAKMIPMRRRCR
jgi:phytoene desaturase